MEKKYYLASKNTSVVFAVTLHNFRCIADQVVYCTVQTSFKKKRLIVHYKRLYKTVEEAKIASGCEILTLFKNS